MWYFGILQLFSISLVSVTTRIVDLAYEENDAMMIWPTTPTFNFTILYRDNYKGSLWFENNYFAQPEHAGTHVDAPAHLNKGSWRTQQIPMEKLFGPGVIIDVKAKAATNPDYRVTIDDVKMWENKYGKIPGGAVVLMNSGWFYKYPNRSKVFNTSNPEDPATFHFPGWHEETTQWLVNYRNINILGVDTPSNDYGQSILYPTHVILAKENIPGVENVANLDKIPEYGSTIYVPVLKLFDGSGGPARIFATIEHDDNDKRNHGDKLVSALSILILLRSMQIILI